MAEEKKLGKILRLFEQIDEATIVAAITSTTMNHRGSQTANEGMENFYHIFKEISTEDEHAKTTIPPTKR